MNRRTLYVTCLHIAYTRGEMTQNRVKLTKASVAAIEVDPARQVLVWDSEIRGFGLRVAPGGAWTVTCRVPGSTSVGRIRAAVDLPSICVIATE